VPELETRLSSLDKRIARLGALSLDTARLLLPEVK
jgi:hypothetical protein